jgi:ribose transport system ATP-binding protein
LTEVPLLSISGLTKAFPGTLALNGVDFDLRRGEIHALLGQNGAGKSTLIKILAGVYEATRGQIRLAGSVVHPSVERLSINFIHQDLGLVDSMSVAENVAVSAGYPRRMGLIDWRETRMAAEKALATMTDDIDPDAEVGELSAAERSIVAIARALATKCDVLVLDEPTASLPEKDVSQLFEALGKLRAAGLGIIYVSHRLDEVFRIADRVTILRDGYRIVSEAVKGMDADRMVSMIVGRDLIETNPTGSMIDGAPILSVENLRSGDAGPVTFSVRPGETLALVGLRGAGHDTIARAIFGNRPIHEGRVMLRGAEIFARTEQAAMAAGIGFISSKRAEESIAAALSVRENLFINPALTGTRPTGWMAPIDERRKAIQIVERYNVRPPDPERSIATLSGGNQQKVIVARWLEGAVDYLILEEPTTGVDIGSKAEIYKLLQTSLSRGMGALLVSSDFEEVAKVSHRALVFSRGSVVAALERSDLTVSRLTTLAAGGERASHTTGEHS